MKSFILPLALLALFGCQTTSKAPVTAESTTDDQPLFYTPEQIKKLEFSEWAGNYILVKDSLAWIASDVLLEKMDVSPIENPLGWLVHLSPEGNHRVSFYHQATADSIAAFADVYYDQDFEFHSFQPNPQRELEDTELKMLHALVTARNQVTYDCSDRYNTVVIEAENGWNVFFMVAPTEENVIPIGGAKRLYVSEDGGSVIETEEYSKSCLALSPKTSENGEETKGLVVTHLVDDVPSPIHVFTSLSYGYPLYVLTKSGIWKVADGEISEVRK